MDISWTDITSVVIAALSALAAGGAWVAARRSAAAASTLTRIERDRRHEERRPRFDLQITGDRVDHATLNVHLAGPDELREVEIVSIRMDNDDRDLSNVIPGPGPGGATREDLDRHVWGPFRFTPRVDTADEDGRAVGPFTLKVGRGRPFQLERTRPGHWMAATTMDDWQDQYRGHPVRLVITCRVDEEEWTMARHVTNPAR